MLGRTYEGQNCSAARALELVGERWSLLIIRDAIFGGTTRFADFQRSLGVARNILAARLDRFVEEGIMERRLYSERPPHHEYVLTDKGRDLQPVVLALTRWGDRWAAPAGAPVLFEHAGCGGSLEHHLVCTGCAEAPTGKQVVARPGPGATAPAAAG
jgi:DNA-binding HxlR family transcriptional regulator